MKWNPKQPIDDYGFDRNVEEIGDYIKRLRQPVDFFPEDYTESITEIDNIVNLPLQGHIVA